MEGKREVKVKLWSIALFIILAILLILGGVLIYHKNSRSKENIIETSKVTQNITETMSSEVTQNIKQKYYEPSQEEKARTAELETILKSNLPSMDGSTSTIPLEAGIKAALFNITQEKAEAGVVHATTYGSYDNLLKGKCDIIFSTPLSENQYESAKKANIELVEIPVVLEGFVFVVNAKNPVSSLTQQQLKDIYSGKITNWKQLGGNDAEIVAYQRNETSGSQNYMKEFMKDSNLIEPKTSYTPESMAGLMDAVATYDNAENAIGYSVYAYAANMYGNGNEIKFIKVDGVEPTKETMASREYPLLNYNYAIYNKKSEETTKVKELTEWLLTYNGQVAMVNAGYVPVKNVKVKEFEIEPYTQTGTSSEIRGEKADAYYYKINANEMYGLSEDEWREKNNYESANNKIDFTPISKLKDKNLQNTINTFIKDSIEELKPLEDECKNYVKLLNENAKKQLSKANEYYTDNYELYGYNGIKTDIVCVNGYLSANVYMMYQIRAQSGVSYPYKSYSKIYDLYTGKEVNLSDLFYKNTNFVKEINEQMELRIPYEIELTKIKRIETKRNFNSLPKDGFEVCLGGLYGDYGEIDVKLVFPKDNQYFVEGAEFIIDTYLDNMSCIYKARDMKGIWEDDVKINIDVYRRSYRGAGGLKSTIEKKETDEYEYDIYYLNTNNDDLNRFINNYINTRIISDAYIKELEEEERKNNTYYTSKFGDANLITVSTSIIGNKYVSISIEGGMDSLINVYFDIENREQVSVDKIDKWINDVTHETEETTTQNDNLEENSKA